LRLLRFGFTATDLEGTHMAFEGRRTRTRTAQRPTMRRPLRSPTTSSSVSARSPPVTPLSTRSRRRRGALFRALRASPASSLIFAGESPPMRCVDGSRGLPRCLDTVPTRGAPAALSRRRLSCGPAEGGTLYTAQRPPRPQHSISHSFRHKRTERPQRGERRFEKSPFIYSTNVHNDP
jgi:hypothetical protein